MAGGRIYEDNHTFQNVQELKTYYGLKKQVKSGLIAEVNVRPPYPLVIEGQHVADFCPLFEFFDMNRKKKRFVCLASRIRITDIFSLKKKIFEILYQTEVELWDAD